MRFIRLGFASALVIAAAGCLLTSCKAGSAPRVFNAAPGTNTLAVARDAVRAWRAAGHTNAAAILLAPGVYALTEPLALDSQDRNETWKAKDANRVLVTGGQKISGFTAEPSGVWRAQTKERFEQLYLNDHRATRARLPGTGYFKVAAVRQEDLTNGKVRLTVTLPASEMAALPHDEATLHRAQLLMFHKWDTSRYYIASADFAGNALTVVGDRMGNGWDAQSRFIIDNCAGGMPLAPGMWMLNPDGVLDYCPREGERLDQAEFYAPALDQLLRINGADNVQFENLRFEHARYEMPPEGCPPAQAASTIGAAIEINGSTRVAFDHCIIAHTGNYAIWFQKGCHDCRIEHCLLEDLGAGGVRIGEMVIRQDPREQTEDVVVDNNIIRRGGRVHPSAVGVWIGQSANDRITRNDINDFFYTGISIGWTWGYGRSQATNNLIAYNCIHRIGQGALSDLGGIYSLGVSPGSASIGNVVFDVRAHDYGGWGIYTDEGSSDWQIESNLVWNCTCVNPNGGGAFHQHYGATNRLANNIFALSSGPPMQTTRVEDRLDFIFEHNLVVSSNRPFLSGPWDKIKVDSESNCFVFLGSGRPPLFGHGDLAQWQSAGHEKGSILTNCSFLGTWPWISLPPDSPAAALGFKMFKPDLAGVYGDADWKKAATEMETGTNGPISPE